MSDCRQEHPLSKQDLFRAELWGLPGRCIWGKSVQPVQSGNQTASGCIGCLTHVPCPLPSLPQSGDAWQATSRSATTAKPGQLLAQPSTDSTAHRQPNLRLVAGRQSRPALLPLCPVCPSCPAVSTPFSGLFRSTAVAAFHFCRVVDCWMCAAILRTGGKMLTTAMIRDASQSSYTTKEAASTRVGVETKPDCCWVSLFCE